MASLDEAAAISDRNAPEHLEIHVANAMEFKKKLQHYGGLFVGEGAAEVLGDYGAGPNHTLPTGGTARSTGGLCALTFLRVRTWMRVDDKVAAHGSHRACNHHTGGSSCALSSLLRVHCVWYRWPRGR